MRVLWSHVSDATLAAVLDRLGSVAKPFGSVTMADLVAASANESLGVYFFFEAARLAYVGKASSRAFIERVPSHLDVRPEGWFGTLLKQLGKAPQLPPIQCVDRALSMRLALLVAEPSVVDIARVEDVFRHGFGPLLNAPRKRRPIDIHSIRLGDVGKR